MYKMPENSKRKRYVEAGKFNQFDTRTQKLLEDVDRTQNGLTELQQRTVEEIVVLEQRNRELRKPWYDQRSAAISQIPNFWVTTLLNHPDISMLLDEDEENCIHHLKKFEVEEFPDITAGYYLKFVFDENPYFENDLLVKEYHLSSDEPKCISTDIIWKDGVRPLGEIYDTSPYSSARKRRIEFKSFFKWFRDYNDPLTDDIAEIFKDDIWTNPLQYFLVPDMESNDAGSSPSDNSDVEEPRKRVKATIRINSKAANLRVKINSSSNASAVSELPTTSNVVAGVSNETRSGDLGEACSGGVTSEAGNVDGENDTGTPIVDTPPGPANVGGSRRRLFMGPDYGF